MENGSFPERGWKMAGKRCIISVLPVRRRGLVGVCLGLTLILAFLLLLIRPGAAPRLWDADRLEAAAKGLTQYDVTLRLDAENAALSISETITFSNATGDALNSLVLRTWLNAYQTEDTSPAALEEVYDECYPEGFSPGGVQIYDVIWNGERAEWSLAGEGKTALRVSIPTLQDGETGTLLLRCVATIPRCRHRTGQSGKNFALGNAVPLLSRYENGEWREDAYSPIGDPFVSDCANFRVTAYLPEGFAPAASCEMYRTGDSWQGEMKAARDFALCAGPDWKTAKGESGGVRLYSFAKTPEGARNALGDAQKALETFASLYGPYPYPTLTVCSAAFPFGGMEYPGLIMIGEENYAQGKENTLELTIAHETAHQWFYALVGSDQAKQPWQDEAICEYAMLRYVRARYGRGSFDTLKYYRVDAPMQERTGTKLTPGSPIDYFGSLNDYATVVYGRGAALLLALDEMLPQGVDAFLRSYAEEFAFQFVSREQLEGFLNAWSGMDLRPLLLDYLDTLME